jgi:hypothetical protein
MTVTNAYISIKRHTLGQAMPLFCHTHLSNACIRVMAVTNAYISIKRMHTREPIAYACKDPHARICGKPNSCGNPSWSWALCTLLQRSRT